MRVAFSATAVRRPPARLLRPALGAATLAALAACAHAGRPVARVASEGEVARSLAPAPAPAPRGGTFRAITLDELAQLVPDAGTRAHAVASTTAPATASAEVWRGTYGGRTYGQRGALALVLRPTTDGRLRGTVAWRVAPVPVAGRGDTPVELVRVPIAAAERDGEQLVLRLDEYFDPACNCTAHATFRGALRGDTLSGRFTVSGAATVVGEERGRWRAVRVTP